MTKCPLILICDDDPVVHESIGIYLDNENYQHVSAFSGTEALSMAESENPNLIILDLMMPGMNGIDVCRTIRQTSRVPIVMLTAKGEEIDRILGLELGADDYIVKPFSPREVLARIKHLVLRLEAPPPCEVEYEDVTVELSESELSQYATFKRELVASIDGQEITAVSAGALTTKLCGWASGGMYFAEDVIRPHTRKREKLTEMFRTLKPPFFVLYWFNFSVEDIKQAAHAAHLRFCLFDSRDPSIVPAWNAGSIDVLAAHPQSAGMGLNLQSGGCIEIWLTLPWSSELWSQTVARLARRGQKDTVRIYRMIARDTIDERISDVLCGKIDLQKLILDEVKTCK
mgnify:CR=1 FL=1